jgi:hypothetical protein
MNPSTPILSSWKKARSEATNWLLPSEAYKIAQMAHELRETYPGFHYVCVGNSLSWPTYTAGIEAALFGQPVETSYAPLSGSLLSYYQRIDDIYCYKPRKEKMVLNVDAYTDSLAKSYRNLLKDKNLSPKSIIDRFQDSEMPTTVMDVILSGHGMATFIQILFSWARENEEEPLLREALQVRLYKFKFVGERFHLPSALKLEGFDPIPCNAYVGERNVLTKLWECPGYVRLVPSYPSSRWHGPPRPAEGMKDVVENTRQVLEEAVVVYNLAPNLYNKWVRDGRAAIENILTRSFGPDEPKPTTHAAPFLFGNIL